MTSRIANDKILPVLVERWSPRSFDSSPLPQCDFNVILEAAALAPSAFNYQPWTFLYALREDQNWDLFLSLLTPFNQSWAKDAGALMFIVSDTLMRSPEENLPSYSHSFDAGAAWVQAALQATALGYHAHAMTGINFDEAYTSLAIPEDYRLEAAVAIGRRASAARLPEGLRAKEMPSGRKWLAEISKAGPFDKRPML